MSTTNLKQGAPPVNLKTVTLLAAIGQTLSVLVGLMQFALNVQEHWFRTNWRFLVSSPIYLLAEISLAVFLFTLYSRQKEE